jgi:hypothetical protein
MTTKTLFLADFEIVRENPGEKDRVERHIRLVWAKESSEAQETVIREYQEDYSNGGRRLVRDISITEPLGSPD